MSKRSFLAALLAALAPLLAGCESLDAISTDVITRLVPAPPPSDKEIALHRQRFQQERSSPDVRWLLAKAVDTGMTVADVGEAMGEPGKRVPNDTWIKSSGGHYRSSDEVYKWGPDNRGKSYYLVFRDGRLVNFNPGEFDDAS
ncbi:MAG: hypothetical protein CMJ78_14555 [Planctomycetaceae bacterium]|nr:hypothetical protein [Planctomycetaceae bacterium]